MRTVGEFFPSHSIADNGVWPAAGRGRISAMASHLIRIKHHWFAYLPLRGVEVGPEKGSEISIAYNA
ncbi:hypothetical protein GCM10017056_29340 [Seohaeicola zhoushanensis]|uniref:Uncharacterized protein n=1 Tax=Seohaeicola zhoushanensis TaxID=1569283 RepID=A0A8J3GYA0_9RHOB|nr:hypothetical protein GCM10017056_29340 [Seohaeicola zhoushanensis]